MNLQIRDKRAHELASELADRRKTSMTEAVITALENELRREDNEPSLQERVARLVDESLLPTRQPPLLLSCSNVRCG